MANKLSKLGGTDYNNGDQLPAADLNDTFDKVSSQYNELAEDMGITNPFFKGDAFATAAGTDTDGTSAGTTKTNVFVDVFGTGNTDKIYGIQAYDLCRNSAVDATLWTATHTAGEGMSNSENTEGMTFTVSDTGGAGEVANLITDNDLSASKAADSTIMFRALIQVADPDGGNSPGLSTVTIQLSDGTDHVTIDSISSTPGATTTTTKLYELRFSQSADTVDIYENGELAHDDVDVSSLTGVIKIRVSLTSARGSGGQSSSKVIFYGLFSSAVSGSPIWQSTALTTPATITNASLLLYQTDVTLNSGTITASVSGNSGTNFEAISLTNGYDRVKITNTGTGGVVKFAYTISEGNGIPKHGDYGAYFNV